MRERVVGLEGLERIQRRKGLWAWCLAGLVSLCLGGCVVERSRPTEGLRSNRLVANQVGRIGGSVDGPVVLTRVEHLLIGPGGRLYVLDAGRNDILVFSREGEFAGSFGGYGQGPGEASAVGGFGLVTGEVWVLDSGNGRIGTFEMNGTRGETWRWQAPSLRDGAWVYSPAVPEDAVFRPDSSVLVQPGASLLAMEATRMNLPLLRMNRFGGIRDTVSVANLPKDSWVSFTFRGVPHHVRAPFAPERLHHIIRDGSGVVIVEQPWVDAENGVFEVHHLSSPEDTTYSERFDYFPIAVTPQLRDRVLRRSVVVGPHAESVDMRRIERALDDEKVLPRFLPAVETVFGDQDGRVWLRRSTLSESSRWEMLTPSGQPGGHVILAGDAEIIAARDDLLVVQSTDDLDVPVLAVLSVVQMEDVAGEESGAG